MNDKNIDDAVDCDVDFMDMVKDENKCGIVDYDDCRDCILRLPDYIGGDNEEKQAVSLDALFDRSDRNTIEWTDENGKARSFAQLAVIVLEREKRAKLCVVAAPLDKTDGADKDELTVFSIAKNEKGGFALKIEEDEEESRAVLDKYRQMAEEARKIPIRRGKNPPSQAGVCRI